MERSWNIAGITQFASCLKRSCCSTYFFYYLDERVYQTLSSYLQMTNKLCLFLEKITVIVSKWRSFEIFNGKGYVLNGLLFFKPIKSTNLVLNCTIFTIYIIYSIKMTWKLLKTIFCYFNKLSIRVRFFEKWYELSWKEYFIQPNKTGFIKSWPL